MNDEPEPHMKLLRLVMTDYHVIPTNDLIPHVEFRDCWCKPTFKDGFFVHNSMDGREKFETGERKPS